MAKKQFKAESKRLLDLMINSIYTHQEIFLREIISNASDAIDKLAYLALTDENVGLSRSDFAIQLKPDETARTLTVSDNGIGMDKDEMENNLGTICRSGSLQFKQTIDKDKAADTDIIGQFGVGFYSAFMVADKVTVISKKYGSDEAWKWESEGADGYTMTPCERAAAGTDVIMQLKADTDDEKYSRFLKTWELQSLVRKYSDYIRYPIRMAVEKSRMKEGTEKSDKPEYETYTEVETLNSWSRSGTGTRRTSPTRNTTISIRKNSSILKTRWPSFTRMSRARSHTRRCCSSPRKRRMISTPRTSRRACSCTPPA